MKKLTVFILIFALLLSFSACAAANKPVTDIEAFEKEVFAAYKKQMNNNEALGFSDFRYYGSDNGYHIVLCVSGVVLTAVTTKTVGSWSFTYRSSFGLYAYRNGKFVDLKTAYNLGLVGDEAIAKAAELHAARKNAIE